MNKIKDCFDFRALRSINFKIIYLLLLSTTSVPSITIGAEKVDIVTSFTLDELVSRNTMAKDTGLKVRYFRQTFDLYYEYFYKPDIKKIILFADLGDKGALFQVPIEKRVFFLWEAPGTYIGELENQCARIYTFNDDVIDNQKYFKFFYPVLMPMLKSLPSFHEKKFCAMITHKWTEKRAQLIHFFETKPFEEFEYYGFSPIIPTDRYVRQIIGHPLSTEKLDILKEFRFCICFENSMVNGYITEKIFTCFAAGCIPVYLGAPNIENYIPKNCFIDYRDFSNDEVLYQFLKSMSEQEYNNYLSHISSFLKSDEAQLFSAKHFNQIILECVNSP